MLHNIVYRYNIPLSNGKNYTFIEFNKVRSDHTNDQYIGDLHLIIIAKFVKNVVTFLLTYNFFLHQSLYLSFAVVVIFGLGLVVRLLRTWHLKLV